MTLWQSLLLFLPLCLVISIITCTPGRRDFREILKHGLRLFLVTTFWVVAASVVIYFVMEWILSL
ncbi:MAG TPA: hypothetical protein ENK43_03120 [Planctomycetes bacterium]|nr:hypothetical protein [Planctomycetota bacterium]